MSPNRYPSDLTDEEWAVVSKLFTKSEHRGAQRKHDLRRIIDGCLYVLRGGISWRIKLMSLRVFPDQDAIIDACCDAWNALVAETGRIKSLCFPPWLQKVIS